MSTQYMTTKRDAAQWADEFISWRDDDESCEYDRRVELVTDWLWANIPHNESYEDVKHLIPSNFDEWCDAIEGF